MRADMAKVIVERPRRYAGYSRKGRRVEFDDLPAHISMRRERLLHGSPKEFNENLAPLRRYLHKQVGRQWSDVYSEICANLRVDSTVQKHVRDHVGDFVELHPEERWITVYRAGGEKERICVSPWRELCVDPADGSLKRNPRREEHAARRRERARPMDTVKLGIARELKLIDGIWYEVEYAPLPVPQYKASLELRLQRLKPWDVNSPLAELEVMVRRLTSAPVWDVIQKEYVRVGPLVDDEASRRRFAREAPKRYAIAKRQASTKVLRRHGLANVRAA